MVETSEIFLAIGVCAALSLSLYYLHIRQKHDSLASRNKNSNKKDKQTNNEQKIETLKPNIDADLEFENVNISKDVKVLEDEIRAALIETVDDVGDYRNDIDRNNLCLLSKIDDTNKEEIQAQLSTQLNEITTSKIDETIIDVVQELAVNSNSSEEFKQQVDLTNEEKNEEDKVKHEEKFQSNIETKSEDQVEQNDEEKNEIHAELNAEKNNEEKVESNISTKSEEQIEALVEEKHEKHESQVEEKLETTTMTQLIVSEIVEEAVETYKRQDESEQVIVENQLKEVDSPLAAQTINAIEQKDEIVTNSQEYVNDHVENETSQYSTDQIDSIIEQINNVVSSNDPIVKQSDILEYSEDDNILKDDTLNSAESTHENDPIINENRDTEEKNSENVVYSIDEKSETIIDTNQISNSTTEEQTEKDTKHENELSNEEKFNSNHDQIIHTNDSLIESNEDENLVNEKPDDDKISNINEDTLSNVKQDINENDDVKKEDCELKHDENLNNLVELPQELIPNDKKVDKIEENLV